jgi:hypothetical protein
MSTSTPRPGRQTSTAHWALPRERCWRFPAIRCCRCVADTLRRGGAAHVVTKRHGSIGVAQLLPNAVPFARHQGGMGGRRFVPVVDSNHDRERTTNGDQGSAAATRFVKDDQRRRGAALRDMFPLHRDKGIASMVDGG